MDLLDVLKAAKGTSTDGEKLDPALKLQRQAQWRVDYVLSENSKGFHAPQESARLLAEAIDFARQGQIKVLEVKR
jgi:nitrite reductase (cytochrome c-552)